MTFVFYSQDYSALLGEKTKQKTDEIILIYKVKKIIKYQEKYQWLSENLFVQNISYSLTLCKFFKSFMR